VWSRRERFALRVHALRTHVSLAEPALAVEPREVAELYAELLARSACSVTTVRRPSCV
jgi:hypothetical protein